MTRPSATINLFAEPSISRRGPGSFILSIVAHAAAGGMVYFGLTHLPQIDERILPERYSVRQLDLHTIDPLAREAAKPQIPGQEFFPDSQSRSALGLPLELTESTRSFLESATGKQTLIQPEFHTHLSFTEELPLPTIVIWTPELASGKKIVAPLPDLTTAANATPSLELPNEEVRLPDFGIASTTLSAHDEAIPAGTTSPVQLHSAKLVEMAPATTSDSLEQPTPTAVLSLSDLRLQDGTVKLPPVNEMASSRASGSTAGIQANQTALSGTVAGNSHESPKSIALADPGPGSDREQSGSKVAPTGKDDDVAEESRLTTEHIVLPKTGRFGVVVVGSALGEEYPEALEIWGDRVAYTAYLHVGLSKNWILQYSVLRSTEAAHAGTVARLEAPWPYDIARPNLTSRDLNADALMVHGILTSAGRFESLAVAFPTRFRYTSFVLHALRQWLFRPARQNGQATAVEVLLIIPDELE
jgi:hypothetical protein